MTVLKGNEKFSYMACDQIKTPRQVLDLLRKQTVEPVTEGDVRSILDSLTDRGLMVRQNGSYLALAYPKSMRSAEGEIDHHSS